MGFCVMNKLLNKTHIHPTFFLFLIYFIFTQNLLHFLIFFIVVLTHEFGHFYVAKKRGYKLDNFYLAPYGACLNYKEKTFESRDEMLIAFAGPAVNFLLSIMIITLWWVFPATYNFTYDFVLNSLMLGLVNLLPCYPLDGGRIVVGFFSQEKERAKVISVLKILNYIFSAIFLLLFVLSCFINFNPSFALVGCFLLMGNFDSDKEGKYQFAIIKNRAKNFSKPMFIYVYENALLKDLVRHLEQNKHTIFVVEYSNRKTKFVDENIVKSLALNFSLNLTLAEIFKQEKA